MKKTLCLFGALLFSLAGAAQLKWYNPQEAGKEERVIRGQGWKEDGNNYRRLPLRAKGKVREQVWNLACESAGLSVRFRTDAEEIRVKYVVTGGFSMPHMPATGVSGVDLYRVEDGAFCFGSYAFGDTVRYSYKVDRSVPAYKEARTGEEQEYELFLPLYNGVKLLEVGVDARCRFSFVPMDSRNPIVVYGTSIAQGACASRPGMAWTNIVQRALQRPVVNLGFSGNGKLEPEVLAFICELSAAAYVLDCMANLNELSAGEVTELVVQAVRQIRERHDAPVLLVEHAGYSNGNSCQERYDTYTTPNRGLREAYERLKKEKVKNLHYLSRRELGYSPDAWVDYVHPSDYGMARQADAVAARLRKLCK